MSTETRAFIQIIGAQLVRIGETTLTHVDLANKQPQIIVNAPTLEFDNGVLTIENPFTLVIGESRCTSADAAIADELEKLVGSSVADARFENESIVVKFDVRASLVISLRKEDFHSPEAGSFSPHSGPIIVFDGSSRHP